MAESFCWFLRRMSRKTSSDDLAVWEVADRRRREVEEEGGGIRGA